MEDAITRNALPAVPSAWMTLEDACSTLRITPRQLGQLVHLGQIERRNTGRAARYRVGASAEAPSPAVESGEYAAALAQRLFELEAERSALRERLRAVERENVALSAENRRLEAERDHAISRWFAAREELRTLIGNAYGALAETRSRVTAALQQVV